MIRLLATAAVVGGLLRYVFGQETRRRKQAADRARTRKPARRASRRNSRPSAA